MIGKTKWLLVPVLFFFIVALYPPGETRCEDTGAYVPDKALCARMLAFGKQFYQRGKYLDAKEYFRKAVQADPGSPTAWRYYDMTVIFGLAEKVEKNTKLLSPGVSTRGEIGHGALLPAAAPPPQKTPPKTEEMIIEDDEGC